MKKTMKRWICVLCITAAAAPLYGSIDSAELKTLLDQMKAYEFGQSRLKLTEIHNRIASVYESPEELQKAEMILLEALRSDGSFALKDFLCRQLSLIGTEASVTALVELLDDEKTAGPALYALARIPSAKADESLLKALPQAKKPVQIGILSALGMRKTAAAVDSIAPLLDGGDVEIAEAAISALGQIATAEAAALIESHRPRIPGSLGPRAEDALLACGNRMIQEGEKTKAEALFQKLYAGGSSETVRAAALSGLVRSVTAPRAEVLLQEAMRKSNPEIQTAAVRLACETSNEKAIAEAHKAMPHFSPLLQVRFLAALTEYRLPSAKKAALASLDAESPAVRSAAFEAMAAVGDSTCVLPLAQAAATATERTQRDQAREALVRLPGKGVNEVIAEAIEKADLSEDRQGDVTAEYIRAAGQRGIREALPAIVRAAGCPNRAVVRESLGSLQTLAEPEDLAQLTPLLNKPGMEVEKTLVVVALKEPERKGRGKAILSFFEDTRDDSVRAAVYRVLGQVGDPDTLESLRGDLYHSKNPAVQKAAFRGLTEWPGPEAMEDMKHFAARGEDEAMKVLAFRAYVRMLRDASLPTEDRVSALVEAMRMAPRESENKIVLAALGQQASAQALTTAVRNLDNESLRAEAQAAITGICEKLAKQQPGMCRTALNKLLESGPSDVLKNRANELLDELK